MIRRLLLTTSLGLATLLPATAQDAADFVVRLNRIENQSRQMSGQIEQLQFENRQLKEQLRKFQEDVEFRFQEKEGKGAAPPARAPAGAAPYGVNPSAPATGTVKPQKRGDAFDPDQNPKAPGAPRALGAAATPSAPPVPRAAAPVVEEAAEDEEHLSPGIGGPVDLSPPVRVPTTGAIDPAPGASVAATGSGDARADFEGAYALVQQRQYEQAEMSLRQFIQSHPRDALVPRATYWLGESYLQRNRSREAAEQFLKVSTDYAGSPVAPEAMLKLGVSLGALGAKQQACATLAEVERKFPDAGPGIRQGVAREQKRARCAA